MIVDLPTIAVCGSSCVSSSAADAAIPGEEADAAITAVSGLSYFSSSVADVEITGVDAAASKKPELKGRNFIPSFFYVFVLSFSSAARLSNELASSFLI